MKIGYPCINRRIGCTANTTFRLKNYSESKLIDTVSNNLNCLQTILKFNVENKLLFFRIGSELIPFASHEVCTFDWSSHFSQQLADIGAYIQSNQIRISMHPDQFVLINAIDADIKQRSILELQYHCLLLDTMNLDSSAKVQIHVGGVYGNKLEALERFVKNYKNLPTFVKKRLVIENDDRSFSLHDCLQLHQQIGIPIIFDSFHHQCLNQGETLKQAIEMCIKTWSKTDGVMMLDYSSQAQEGRRGKHTASLDEKDFTNFIQSTKRFDFDIMLEIKDKEASALKALQIAQRFRPEFKNRS